MSLKSSIMCSIIKQLNLLFCLCTLLLILPLSSKCQVDIDKLIINAKNGDAQSQFTLGNCYFNGHTKLPKSEEKSFYWIKKAADQGYVDAQFNMAAMYSGFFNIKKDLSKVIYWYHKAAEQGSAKAYFKLGICSYYGDGVPVDFIKSSECFKKAILINPTILKDKIAFLVDRRPMRNKNIINDLADSFNFGVNTVKINKSLAFFWYEKCAVDLKIDNAQFNLGVKYEHGESTIKDLRKAFFWFSEAANQGHLRAQCVLGKYYANGMGTLMNINKANYWWTKAANRNDAEAQFDLAISYCYGNGVPKDLVKAAYWAKKAYDNGSEKVKELWDQEELWKYVK